MEELLEMIAWFQLGIHEKPVSWCLVPTSEFVFASFGRLCLLV